MSIELPVQWGDQDAFGHVNNTVYFRWYESARIAYLERLAMADQNSALGLGPILAAIGSNYRRQVRWPDRVIIGSRVTRIGRTSFTMEHAVWSTAQQAIVADGHATIVVFDYARCTSSREVPTRSVRGNDRSRTGRPRDFRKFPRAGMLSAIAKQPRSLLPLSGCRIVAERNVADKLNESVVRHMRDDLACLDAGSSRSVGDALTMIRQEPPGGRIIYFYVVDSQLRLVGVLPTRRLLLSPPETRISEIMITSVIAIPDSATVLEACEFFTLHRLLAFPVVDARHRIIGVVDIELYTEELDDVDRQQRGDDLFQLVGVHIAQAKLGSPWATFASRFPWLLCNIGGGLLAAALAEMFAAELKKVVALALFIPVVLALAESVSIQSVSLALQTLRGQRPTWGEILRKLSHEFWTGGLLGIASGGSVAQLAALALAGPRPAGPLSVCSWASGWAWLGMGDDRWRGDPESLAPRDRRSALGRGPDRAGQRRHVHAGSLLQPGPLAALAWLTD